MPDFAFPLLSDRALVFFFLLPNDYCNHMTAYLYSYSKGMTISPLLLFSRSRWLLAPVLQYNLDMAVPRLHALEHEICLS